jgi:hypothetical protein
MEVPQAEDTVMTTKGLVNRSSLTMKMEQSEDDRAIYAACEWYLGEELVRRDGWVNLKRGATIGAEQAVM